MGAVKAKLIAGKLTKGTTHSAGYDLCSEIKTVIFPKNEAIIPTGVFLEIQKGYEGQVRGRSGLNFKHGVVVPTGTIDADYRGEVKVKLYNTSYEPFAIEIGDRIAQLIISEHFEIEGAEVKDVCRDTNGFGSTGLS